MSYITVEEVVEFSKKLLVECQKTHPTANVELQQAPTGHYMVIIHSDNTLQSVNECYTIDPISRDWIKTYGSL